ncbi:MAG TPA: hypothetical protein VKA30_10455 [Actinomycetota bacterium]|nr:hypothetical protein [Actinomycetota bacterium]
MSATTVPDSATRGWLLPARVWQQLVGAAMRLGIVGLIAIGVSGVLADGMGMVFGKSFVAGTRPGYTYPAERCAEYLEYEPGAATCEDAATRHHYGEVVQLREATGVLGLLALGAYWLFRRRWRGLRDPSALPDGFEATVGTAIFGVAAAGLVLIPSPPILLGDSVGTGDLLSGGIVALIVAVAYGVSLYRTLIRRSALTATSTR